MKANYIEHIAALGIEQYDFQPWGGAASQDFAWDRHAFKLSCQNIGQRPCWIECEVLDSIRFQASAFPFTGATKRHIISALFSDFGVSHVWCNGFVIVQRI